MHGASVHDAHFNFYGNDNKQTTNLFNAQNCIDVVWMKCIDIIIITWIYEHFYTIHHLNKHAKFNNFKVSWIWSCIRSEHGEKHNPFGKSIADQSHRRHGKRKTNDNEPHLLSSRAIWRCAKDRYYHCACNIIIVIDFPILKRI